MGGRRSYSLKDVVGTGRKVGRKKATLTTSFKAGDIGAVSRGSADLVVEHRDIGKIVLYSTKLFNSLKGKYSPSELTNLKDINRKVRVAWASVKSKDKLKSNSIIDSAVVDSVSRVLKERA